MINDAELRSFKLFAYKDAVIAAGLQFLQHAIIEMRPPDDAVKASAFVNELGDRIKKGERVLVHCRGGVGRAGMIAACVLLYLGKAIDPESAIVEVRRRRCPTAIETSRQEVFVHTYWNMM